jgi:saccharopine dehydrogenase (NAD+, L-lysine-forming)
MLRAMSDFAVIVYGASGFTGRLVCAELARRQISFAIAGRDRAKLTALAASLPARPEVLEAALDDSAGLRRAIARGRVVLACAGPFARLGKPVRDAALAEGRHYLDITGEASYMLETYECDAEAKARGVALINAVGFDVVPTDSAAALATEAAGGGKPDELRIAIKFGGRSTQGTTRSAMELADRGGLAFLAGQYTPEPVGRDRWEAPFPGKIGTRTTVSIPWGDLATAPRTTGARTVRTYVVVPPVMAPLAPLVGIAGKALGWQPVRDLAERWIQSLPEGPSDAERASARCAVVAEARTGPRTGRAWVTCGDGYDFTAAAAVECAARAAAPEFTAKGALTPAQAFGGRALLEALQSSGVEFGVT